MLRFATGAGRMPLDGFSPPFQLTMSSDDDPDDELALPHAHTCFNQLVLPRYRTRTQLKDRLMFAVANTEGFHLS